MNQIEITPNNILSSRGRAQFILLGDNATLQPNVSNPVIRTKLFNPDVKDSIPGFWGTLGRPDNKPINFTGSLSVSKFGNDFSSGVTLKHIQELYGINPLLNNENNKVIERCINFDNVKFENFDLKIKKDKKGNTIDNIPKLRLTIFLEKDEGALAFYQHSKGSYENEESHALEYILPVDEPVVNRDRITYVFPILLKNRITLNENKKFDLGVDIHNSFVIKVLIFKRDNSAKEPTKVLHSIIKNVSAKSFGPPVNNESSKYKLFKFDPANNVFVDVGGNQTIIDTKLKTLLLIHGTFSTTEGSFGGLRDQRYNGRSWLQIAVDQNKYGQILAFDHPTITEDAEQNVAVLFSRLNGVNFISNPVDIITTSRGGLVGKYLICLNTNSTLPVNKAALIACANGVGYFTTGDHIGKLLGIFKSFAGGPIGSIILGIAQFSVNTFLNMPGAQLMTPGSERLNNILNATPQPFNNKITFKAIVGDWDKQLVVNENLIKRLGERGLDLVIQLMLGKANDWVVGTDNQKKLPANYQTILPTQVMALHTQYLKPDFTIGDVHKELNNFLN